MMGCNTFQLSRMRDENIIKDSTNNLKCNKCLEINFIIIQSKYLKMHENFFNVDVLVNSLYSAVSVGMQQLEVRLKQEGASWPRVSQVGVRA